MARPINVTYCTPLVSGSWMSNSGKVRHLASSKHLQLSLNLNLITFFKYLVPSLEDILRDLQYKTRPMNVTYCISQGSGT